MDGKFNETIFYVYIVPIICIFGIIGNIFNLFTLRRKTLKDSPYTYLTALAIFELIFLLTVIGIAFVRCGSCNHNNQEDYIARVYEYFVYLPVGNLAHYSASFITLAMTVERYIFVRFPLFAKKLCTKKNARISIIFVVVIAVIISMPRYFMFSIHTSTMTENVPSTFTVLECSFPFKKFNTTTNVTLLHPRCVLSRLTIFNSTDNFLDFITQKRFLERDFHVFDSLDALGEKLGILIPTSDKESGKCYDIVDNNYDNIEEEFLSFANRTKLSKPQRFKIEPFRFLIVGNSTWMNLFKNVSLGITSLPISSSLTLDGVPTSSSFLSDEIRLLLNITNNDEFVNFTKIFFCFQDYRTTSHSRSSSNIIYNSSAVIVKKTSFHGSANRIIYYTLCTFEISTAVVTGLLNFLMIRHLYQSIHNRQKLMAKSNFALKDKDLQNQHRLTLTLVVASSFAVISSCFSVLIIEPVGECLFGDNFRKNDTFLLILVINNTLTLINNSINFVLYALLNTRFRREFLFAVAPIISFFCCCFKVLNSKLISHKNVDSNCNRSTVTVNVSVLSSEL